MALVYTYGVPSRYMAMASIYSQCLSYTLRLSLIIYTSMLLVQMFLLPLSGIFKLTETHIVFNRRFCKQFRFIHYISVFKFCHYFIPTSFLRFSSFYHFLLSQMADLLFSRGWISLRLPHFSLENLTVFSV